MSGRSLLVVAWPLPGTDSFVGRPAFWLKSVETARRTVAAVVSAVREELLERDEGLPTEVEDPRCLRREVEVRPTVGPPQRAGQRRARIATPDPIVVPVDVVYGRVGEGLYLCEILQFRHVFWLRDPAGLPALVDHFVRDEVVREPVEAIFSLTLSAPPELVTTQVRPRAEPRGPRPPPETLAALADRVTGPPPGTPGPWERGAEVGATEAALEHGRSLLLVGPRRVGKSAVLTEAVRRRRRGPAVWRTQADRLVAGTRWLGEWQERCDTLIREVVASGSVLWVEDAVRLFRIGGRSPEESVGAWLSAAMADGLRLAVELTPAELEAVRATWPAFLEGFERIEVRPLSDAELGLVARRLSEHHQHHRGVQVEDGAHRLARRLLERFGRDEAMPGALVAFLGDCVTEAGRRGRDRVDGHGVVEAFGARTGMPAVLLDDRIPLAPDAVRAFLTARVMGQPAAVDTVTDVLVRFKAGLENPRRPVATLLFAGPTGVGKTATARALAEWAFGSDRALVRVDMSECQDPARVARWIGTPDGEPGELVRKVRERPFTVVLLDEVEKAHPVFFDILLGVLDEGTLTDPLGRTTSFRGAVVVLTTNLGTSRGTSLGLGADGAGGFDRGALRRFFRPEFLNRIDRVVAYGPLSLDVVRDIALRELAALERRPGFASRRLRVVCSDEVLERVVRAGFDPAAGARPLERAVEQGVVAAVARHVLRHPDLQDVVLAVDVVDGEWIVS